MKASISQGKTLNLTIADAWYSFAAILKGLG